MWSRGPQNPDDAAAVLLQQIIRATMPSLGGWKMDSTSMCQQDLISSMVERSDGYYSTLENYPGLFGVKR